MPWARWIGRICEEFPCYGPEEAEAAWLRAPVGWFEEIIEARVFAQAYAMVDAADTKDAVDRLPNTPMVKLAKTIVLELGRE